MRFAGLTCRKLNLACLSEASQALYSSAGAYSSDGGSGDAGQGGHSGGSRGCRRRTRSRGSASQKTEEERKLAALRGWLRSIVCLTDWDFKYKLPSLEPQLLKCSLPELQVIDKARLNPGF